MSHPWSLGALKCFETSLKNLGQCGFVGKLRAFPPASADSSYVPLELSHYWDHWNYPIEKNVPAK
jgi:hypothetical protein